jgi:hypothetical protein
LEITQLRKLAEEKLGLFRQFRETGLSVEASVALIAGSVVALRPTEEPVPVKKPVAPSQALPTEQNGEEPDLIDEMFDEPQPTPKR